MKLFGQKVKFYRNLMNLTQEQLAEKYECSPQTISGTENGYSFPCSKVLFNLSIHLNVPLAYLFNFDNNSEITDNETTEIIRKSLNKMSSEQKKIALKVIRSMTD